MLPCISKIFEAFTNTALTNFALEAGMIKLHQFAFMKHSSTTIALIKAVDSWKTAIDNTEKVVCAFLDLRKAFDTIDSQHSTTETFKTSTWKGVRVVQKLPIGEISICQLQWN